MYACDIDPAEFYSETFPVARKVHRCCECRAPILVGEKHLYARGKNEGDFWYVRQHLACRDACMAIARIDGCICFGDMSEWWMENKPAYEHPEIRKLVAKVIWRARRRQAAGRG